MTGTYAAVVLAGGLGRRMGGDVPKPELVVGGRTLLARVLDAVTGAAPCVVVGPRVDAVAAEAPDVLWTREEPPGAGPVAALRAGLAHVPDGVPEVAVLAADLPFLDARAVAGLRAARGEADCAVLVDDRGAEQWLCAVWSTAALSAAVVAEDRQAIRGLYAGRDMRRWAPEAYTPSAEPWRDVDSPADLERSRTFMRDG